VQSEPSTRGRDNLSIGLFISAVNVVVAIVVVGAASRARSVALSAAPRFRPSRRTIGSRRGTGFRDSAF
jgi:hypothetical protein